MDNLSLKFCGIILDVHCRKNFGISWADKRTGRFLTDLRSRIDGRFQFTTDGYEAYKTCASRTLGPDVDFAQLIKLYANPKDNDGERRYSASQCIGTRTVIRHGKPDSSQISTSYVERANLTNRLFNLTLNRQKMPYNCKHHAAGGHFMCHDNRAELG